MNDLTALDFEGSTVRVVQIDGAPWFVGRDVAERLGYADPTNAMKQHCKGVVKRHPLQTSGGTQEARVLSEPDVLRLIVGSKLPAAERFERWVFEEVLPSIRRTGRYGAVPDLSDPAVLQQLLLEQVPARIVAEGRAAQAERALAARRPEPRRLDPAPRPPAMKPTSHDIQDRWCNAVLDALGNSKQSLSEHRLALRAKLTPHEVRVAVDRLQKTGLVDSYISGPRCDRFYRLTAPMPAS